MRTAAKALVTGSLAINVPEERYGLLYWKSQLIPLPRRAHCRIPLPLRVQNSRFDVMDQVLVHASILQSRAATNKVQAVPKYFIGSSGGLSVDGAAGKYVSGLCGGAFLVRFTSVFHQRFNIQH